MTILTPDQTDIAVRQMREYLNSTPDPTTGLTPVEQSRDLDRNRLQTIEARLRPLLQSYLAGETPLDEFKRNIDAINKQNQYWGFKGVKGQMFFNLLFNGAQDRSDLDAELKAAIRAPESIDVARSRIRTFASFVRRVGEAVLEAGEGKHSRPKQSSVPFFLSYFWQVQAPETWPVYYTNSVETLSDLHLFETTDELSEDYATFRQIHLELATEFSKASGRTFSQYDVEHVWWFVGRKRTAAPATSSVAEAPGSIETAQVEPAKAPLPDSYVPPIVAVLPHLAANDPELEAAAAASGTNIPRALEKCVNVAFTILGFDTKLLGQGTGRMPDGIAIAEDEHYAILWDAKARKESYSMNTDDRTIREYITTQSREFKRRRHFRNIYYFIVSSRFPDDCDELIQGIKMETDINEVCLVEAEALVAMVEAKLRDPRQFSLGADGIQRLFCQSGTITAQDVRDALG